MIRKIDRATAALVFLYLAFGATAWADGTLKEDVIRRRQAVSEKIGEDAVLILFSAPSRPKTGDVSYEYRQENNLYYLSGISQSDTTLVLMPGNRERKELIFVQDRDPRREHWTGKILSYDEIRQISGIQHVYSAQRFNQFINSILYSSPFDVDRYGATAEYDVFFASLRKGNAEVYLCFQDKVGLDGELTREFEFANLLRERFFGFSIRDVWPILKDIRQIKSPYEIRMIREAIDITGEAHLAAMKAMKPGIWEYQIEAAVEQLYKQRNAFDWAFPSIVASGPNATILHYESSQRQVQEGDLVLMDLGAEYSYYAADITRTVPVNGKFSEAQAEIYQVVLQAQEAAMKIAKPGVMHTEIHKKAVEVVKDGLKRLGLITDTNGDQYKMYFTHGTSHWLGMDVHDVGDSRRALEPGMIFTVEPGIYVQADALDRLPDTPEMQKFKEAVRPSFEKYKNIGVRIEDDILITAGGYELLSSRAPRSIDGIEKFFANR